MSGRIDIVARVLRSLTLFPEIARKAVLIIHAEVQEEEHPITTLIKLDEIRYGLSEHEAVREIVRSFHTLRYYIKFCALMHLAMICGYRVVVLCESGPPLTFVKPPVMLVLGTNVDPPDTHVKVLRASIGPLPYLASHVVEYVSHKLQKSISL